jgi:hypothetical protein
LCIFALTIGLAFGSAWADEKPGPKAQFFQQKVLPVLKARCFECHGPNKQENGLRLDSLEGMLTGGDSGPVVVPGNPNSSLLVDAINFGDVFQMPPSGKLKDAEIAVLTDWIADGAVWPAVKRRQPVPKP